MVTATPGSRTANSALNSRCHLPDNCLGFFKHGRIYGYFCMCRAGERPSVKTSVNAYQLKRNLLMEFIQQAPPTV